MRPLHDRPSLVLHGRAGFPPGPAGRGEGGDMKRTLTVCPYCGTGCMLHLLSEGGRLTGVEPGTPQSVSRGSLCVKGWNAFAFVGHPERLTVPLVSKDGVLARQAGTKRSPGWSEGLKGVQAKPWQGCAHVCLFRQGDQ